MLALPPRGATAGAAGQGCKLYDAAGKEYVDWAAGIAVNALGHSDPGVADAVAQQMRQIQHLSNLFHSYEPLHLAKMLVESSAHLDRVFLCNSGTEANEAALKFAKKYYLAKGKAAAAAAAGGALPAWTPGCKRTPPTPCYTTGGMCSCWPQVANEAIAAEVRHNVIAFKGSFHGRSMGSLAATHKPQIRQPFGPFPPDVSFARFNNIDGTRASPCRGSARSARPGHAPPAPMAPRDRTIKRATCGVGIAQLSPAVLSPAVLPLQCCRRCAVAPRLPPCHHPWARHGPAACLRVQMSPSTSTTRRRRSSSSPSRGRAVSTRPTRGL
jgi:hypothetical protein